MYEGLYDPRKGLSDKDAKLIGAMAARLVDSWGQWIHRRVERVTFCDEDALNRDVSIDFTLPYWFHELRETPNKKTKRQLVPLGFLRKGSLVNFTLRNEADESLPLLTRPQSAQIAEAILKALAYDRLAATLIDKEINVPAEICCDIRDLIREPPSVAKRANSRLLTSSDHAWQARQLLNEDKHFVVMAELFQDHFLALSMFNIRRNERRVVHLSYEEPRSSPDSKQFKRVVAQMLGRARKLTTDVTSLCETASHHIELEAPTGLMITARASFYFDGQGNVIKTPLKEGTFKRAHFHFFNAPLQSSATVAVQLRPRKSSGLRAATLMALYAFVATLATTLRFSHIENGTDRNAAAAALLLAAAGIIGLVVVRSGEDEIATTLLFPLRVLASGPVVLAALAAIVIVVDPTAWIGYVVLGTISLLIVISAGLLVWNWHVVRRAARRSSS